jgi:hypothetical protein
MAVRNEILRRRLRRLSILAASAQESEGDPELEPAQ